MSGDGLKAEDIDMSKVSCMSPLIMIYLHVYPENIELSKIS